MLVRATLLLALIAVVPVWTGTTADAAGWSSAAMTKCPRGPQDLSGSGLEAQCSGEPVYDCFARDHSNAFAAAYCGFSGRAYIERFAPWQCSLTDQECYPDPCRRYFEIAFTFDVNASRIRSTFEIPLTMAPGVTGVLSPMVQAEIANSFDRVAATASNGMDLSCGNKTQRALLPALIEAKKQVKPTFTISIGRNILFSSLPKAKKAAAFADLIETALNQATGTQRSTELTSKKKFRFKDGTKKRMFTAKMRYGSYGNGSISLTISR